MPIVFACKQCGRKLRVRDELAGQVCACPQCKSKVRVPKKPTPLPEEPDPSNRRGIGDEQAGRGRQIGIRKTDIRATQAATLREKGGIFGFFRRKPQPKPEQRVEYVQWPYPEEKPRRAQESDEVRPGPPAAPQPQIVYVERPRSTLTFSGMGGALAVLILWCVAIVLCCGGPFANVFQSLGKPSDFDAEINAKVFVTEQLKAPSTAHFGGCVTKDRGDGEYQVAGSVDSQNSFGATLRQYYVIVVKHVGGGKWRVVAGPRFADTPEELAR